MPSGKLTALRRVIPVLTGALLVVNARMGEQQRPTQSPRAWYSDCSQAGSRPADALGVASWRSQGAAGVLVRAARQAPAGRPHVFGPGQPPQGERHKDSSRKQTRRTVMVREGRLCARPR